MIKTGIYTRTHSHSICWKSGGGGGGGRSAAVTHKMEWVKRCVAGSWIKGTGKHIILSLY